MNWHTHNSNTDTALQIFSFTNKTLTIPYSRLKPLHSKNTLTCNWSALTFTQHVFFCTYTTEMLSHGLLMFCIHTLQKCSHTHDWNSFRLHTKAPSQTTETSSFTTFLCIYNWNIHCWDSHMNEMLSHQYCFLVFFAYPRLKTSHTHNQN